MKKIRRLKNSKYDCDGGEYCEFCGHYIPCEHDTKEEAEKHKQELEKQEKEYKDYMNEECLECNNGTLRKDCNNIFHRLPKVKWKKFNWRVKTNEENN